MEARSTSIEDYRVELDAYNGPLDLLLYLVRRDEIDLNNVPISELTEQYLAHLEAIQSIDVDLAGEFLVVAATLVEIKSQMLLPRDESAAPDDNAGLSAMDPRFELVQQLLAYKKYKDAAIELEGRREEWSTRFAAMPSKAPKRTDENAAPLEVDLDDVDILTLCKAFANLMDSIGQSPATHDVVYDDTPIALHAEDILDRMRRDAPKEGMTLQQMFKGRTSRSEMIGLFLATLELVRQRKVRVVQSAIEADVLLQARDDSDDALQTDAATDWRNAETGEVEYEWTDERAKRRYDRRQRMRERRAAEAAGEVVGDADDDIDDDAEDDDIEMDDVDADLAGDATIDAEDEFKA